MSSQIDRMVAGFRKAFNIAAAVNAPDGTAIPEDQRLGAINDALAEVRAALETRVAKDHSRLHALDAAHDQVAKTLDGVERSPLGDAEPVRVTKAATARALDEYVESRRFPRESHGAALLRLTKEDRTVSEVYDAYCAAPPDPLPEPVMQPVSKEEQAIEAKAERLRREYRELTAAQAVAKALELDPAAYDAYLRANPAQLF